MTIVLVGGHDRMQDEYKTIGDNTFLAAEYPCADSKPNTHTNTYTYSNHVGGKVTSEH